MTDKKEVFEVSYEKIHSGTSIKVSAKAETSDKAKAIVKELIKENAEKT